MKERGIYHIGMGVSGGEEGARNGERRSFCCSWAELSPVRCHSTRGCSLWSCLEAAILCRGSAVVL